MADAASARIRGPAVAGSFYPGSEPELARVLDSLLGEEREPGALPKAIIAPHAGYIYSGPVAASAYRRVVAARDRVRRVVLLGPAHRVPFRGLAASRDAAFATPLGQVPVDQTAVQSILALPQVVLMDEAFDGEHSLEVHLPFLQRLLDDFALVPLVVGMAAPETVAEVLERLWGGPETLVVVSSDLSHYYDYETARRLDAATSRAIEALAPDEIDDEGACGRMPIRGLLHLARERGLAARTIDLRNSGDTAGSKDQVVGYGAYLFHEAAAAGLTDEDREALLDAAAGSVRHGLEAGRPPAVDLGAHPAGLTSKGASFVTLKRGEALRGCIGSVQPDRPLVEDVVHNAYAAAFSDSRFPPLRSDEYEGLSMSISVMGPLLPMAVSSEAALIAALRPGRDGLVIDADGRRGVFLPQVWEALPEARRFVAQLKAKAGVELEPWPASARAFTFGTESFGTALPRG